MTNANDFTNYDAFVDAAASAGLEPLDGTDEPVPAWLRSSPWEAFRINGGDSISVARLDDDNETIYFKVLTMSGVIVSELTFRTNTFDIRAFEAVASLLP